MVIRVRSNFTIRLRWMHHFVSYTCLRSSPKCLCSYAFYLKADLVQAVLGIPAVILDIIPAFIPYSLVMCLFGAFVVHNGGVVLGI
jgi:DIE2/ALG10 family